MQKQLAELRTGCGLDDNRDKVIDLRFPSLIVACSDAAPKHLTYQQRNTSIGG
jgi:hypothetical protein